MEETKRIVKKIISENLWNMAKGKTKAAIEYVENLEVPLAIKSDTAAVVAFEKKRELALQQTTANDMLEVIGYEFKG